MKSVTLRFPDRDEYRKARSSDMSGKADRPKVPEFKTEADEAQWWNDHVGMGAEELAHEGVGKRGAVRKLIKDAGEWRNIIIRLPVHDIERAQELAEKKGIGYQTYMELLLREALDREQLKA
jgi:hypothetical protein